MKKIICLLSFLLILSVSVFAQSPAQSTVYLKNGSIIHGSIIEWKPEVSITIKTPDGSTIVVNNADIDRVTWITESVQVKAVPIANDKEFRRKGFSFSVETGCVFYVNQNAGVVPGLYGLLGYHLSPYVCLSVGGGGEIDGGYLVLPFYADCKIYVNNTPNSFLIGIDAGYSHINYTGGEFGGYNYGGMGQLYLGGRYTISKHFVFNYAGGYRMQTIYTYGSDNTGLPIMSGILIKLGFTY